MDWQPIETAPKDGTRILVWDKEDQLQYVAEYRKGGKKWLVAYGYDDYYNVHCVPSFWMPLPNPPEDK